MTRGALAAVVACQFAALMGVAALIGDNGWDDGAITLAFARTFAQHGTIALTPASESVEGFSSIAWFLLNSAVALFGPGYQAGIFASQLLAALCFCAATWLLARVCAQLAIEPFTTCCALIAFGAWGASFAECVNGMEMGLLTLSFLALAAELLCPAPRTWRLAALTALVLLTRFEAMAYVAGLGLALLLARRTKLLLVLFLTSVVVLAGATLWRVLVFDDLLPNTIRGKMWPPYAGADLAARLRSRWLGITELLRFFIPSALLLLVWMRGSLRSACSARREQLLLLALPVAAAIAAGGIIGRNWGYVGRMPSFAAPLVLLIFAALCSSWITGTPGAGRGRKARTALLFALAALTSLVLSFPRDGLALARAGGGFGTTPRTFKETGAVVQRLMGAAGVASATFLTPDVGGLALCCEEIAVVDLGLLTSRRLAHDGYDALEAVLLSEQPDVIEAHWKWAELSRLYELPAFKARYVPAFAGRTKLWVHRALANEIRANGGCDADPRADPALREALANHRYAKNELPGDREAFARFETVVVLDDSDATQRFCRRP